MTADLPCRDRAPHGKWRAKEPRLSRMRKLTVELEGAVCAPAKLVYRLIADDEHHQRFLPTGVSDFKVLEGGIGAGTLHRFTVTAGGRRGSTRCGWQSRSRAG